MLFFTDGLGAWIAWLALVFVFTYAVTDSAALTVLRLLVARVPGFFGQMATVLVYCPVCTGFWVGVATSGMLPLEDHGAPLQQIISGGLAALMHATLGRLHIVGLTAMHEGALHPPYSPIRLSTQLAAGDGNALDQIRAQARAAWEADGRPAAEADERIDSLRAGAEVEIEDEERRL